LYVEVLSLALAQHASPPPQVAVDVVQSSESKAGRSTAELIVLGFLAGAYIAFGAQLCTVVTSDLAAVTGSGLSRLVGGLVFSLGLILVVLGGAELFTGNNLIFLGVLAGRVPVRSMLRNWAVVYLANFAGSLLLVFMMYGTGLWEAGGAAVGARAVSIAAGKVSLGWGEAFLRGVACNWLVCLAVWLAIASRDPVGKILGIVFPVTAFVACGFEHSIANMYFIPMGILLKAQAPVVAVLGGSASYGALTWTGFVVGNLIPVTAGNIMGGAGFVAAAYWVAYGAAMKPGRALAATRRQAGTAEGTYRQSAGSG